MRFSKIALSYGPDDHFIFSLDKTAITDRFVVKSITGLEPPPVDVKINNGKYQGRKPQNKEIMIILGLQPNYESGETPRELRNELYQLLTPKFDSLVTFSLLNDNFEVLASVEGHVKTMEATKFSKVTDVPIVLSCVSPYFVGPIVDLSDMENVTTNPVSFVNPGNAPSGFNFKITLTAPADFVTFSMSKSPTTPKFRIEYPFDLGDTISISSEPGDKSAKSETGSVTINLMPYISFDSKWLELHAGINEFYVATTDFTSQYILNSFSFLPKYWGV